MPRSAVEIQRDDESGIAWLYMNRPEKLNAMNPAMHYEMVEALDELERDDSIGVVVLTGAGRAFCAGQDLQEFFRDLADKPLERTRASRASQEWRVRRLRGLKKITIAMVNGWTCGGAFTQLINCDLAIAAQEADFCISEVNWGILPGGMVMKALTECLRSRDALYFALTAERFTGIDAERIGLVNKAVPADELKAVTTRLATDLLAKNRRALIATKEAFRAVANMDLEQSEDYLAAKVAQLRYEDRSRGQEAGIRQFLDEKSYRPAMEAYRAT